MRDDHTHCPCNGVMLCPTCHAWVHVNPTEALGAGLVLSRAVLFPARIPLLAYYGTVMFDCSGNVTKED